MIVFGLILPMLYAMACGVALWSSRRANLIQGTRAALAILLANLVVFVPHVPLITRAYLAPLTLPLAVWASRAASEAAFQERTNKDRQDRLESAVMAFAGAAIVETLVTADRRRRAVGGLGLAPLARHSAIEPGVILLWKALSAV